MKRNVNNDFIWSASTASAHYGRRGDSWCAALESFTDVQELTIANEAEFEGKLSARRFPDDVLIVDLSAQPNTLTHRVTRQRTDDAIFAMVFFAGNGSVAQCGRSVDFRTGDVIFRGSNQLTQLQLVAPSRALGIFIPTNRFCSAVLPGLQEITYPFTVSADRPLAATMNGLFSTIAPMLSALDDASFKFIEEAIVDLVWGCVVTVNTNDYQSPRSTIVADRWRAITSVIEARLCDPELRIGDIAGIVGCSVRWLQKNFAAQGTNFEKYLLHRRLEHSRRTLVTLRTRSITQVAFDCGFNDLGHFSRSFKERFGRSPRTYREDV